MAARTEIKVGVISRFSLVTATSPYSPATADVTNGNFSANDGYTWLELTNAAGASRTVTVLIPGGVDQDLAAPSRVFTLPSNGIYYTGVFPMGTYGAQLLYTASGSGISFRAFSLRGGV